MAITVFARIRREHLREMYLSYCYTGRQGGDGACSEKVLGLVALYARAALLDLVAETRTEDFFRERVRIIEAMTDVVREAVAPLHMEIFMLNLREVVFDEEVGAAAVLRVASACGQGCLGLWLGLPRPVVRVASTAPSSGGPVGVSYARKALTASQVDEQDHYLSRHLAIPCDTLRSLAITHYLSGGRSDHEQDRHGAVHRDQATRAADAPGPQPPVLTHDEVRSTQYARRMAAPTSLLTHNWRLAGQ